MWVVQSNPASFHWRRPMWIYYDEDDIKLENSPAIQKVISDKKTIARYWWTKTIKETLNEVEKILKAEYRWLGTIIPPPNWVKETNREHILWMLWILNHAFPNIYRFCNMRKVILAILVHDIWEYRIGDIAQSNPNAEKLKKARKRYERKIASILISKIPNDQLKTDAQEALDSYFDFSLDEENIDIEILVVKLLDKLQWFIFWLEKVFYWNLESEREYVLKNIKENFNRIVHLINLLERTMIEIMTREWINSTWQYLDMEDHLKRFVKDNYWIDV